MRRAELLADCGEIRPRRSNVCYAIRREANLKCLILTIFITGSTAWAVIWCGKTTRVTKVDFNAFPIATSTQVSPCDNGFSFILAAFIVMLYLLYLVECWYSKAREVISAGKVDVNSVYRKVEQMRGSKPLVWWKAVSYHYVRRTKQFSHSRNGKTYTSSKVVNERVNAHASTSCFLYAHCGMRDISRDLVDLEKYPLTKVTFSKAFIFSNALAAAEFEHQRATFFQEESGYDDYVEMKEGLDLIGVSFQDSILACPTPDSLPWFLRKQSFWLFSSVLLSWPLRILLTLKTAHVHFQVTKLFGTKMMGPDVTYPWTYMPPPHQWWKREAALLAGSNVIGASVNDNGIQNASSSAPTTATTASCSSSSGSSHDKKSAEDKFLTEKTSCHDLPLFIPHYIPPSYQVFRNSIGGIPRSFTLLMPHDHLHPDNPRSSLVAESNHHQCVGKSCSFQDDLSEQEALVPSYSEALLLGDHNHASHSGQNDSSRLNTVSHRESPPDYIQALQTSRPVFLPPIFRLRRCQTEKRVGRRRRSICWLEDVQPTFLHGLKPPCSSSSGTSAAPHVNNDRREEEDEEGTN